MEKCPKCKKGMFPLPLQSSRSRRPELVKDYARDAAGVIRMIGKSGKLAGPIPLEAFEQIEGVGFECASPGCRKISHSRQAL